MKNYLIFIMFSTFLLLFIASVRYVVSSDKSSKKDSNSPHAQTATFAGGCFWCVESDFEKLPGVISAVSGYAGGKEENPTYHQVSSGTTGHTEAVSVTFDANQVSYDQLLDYFLRHIDPTDRGGQFADRGKQYRPAIFYHDEAQKAAARASITRLEKSETFSNPLSVEIVALDAFYPAEDYHQDYYRKNPLRYKLYRSGSGRDSFLKKSWGDKPAEQAVPVSGHSFQKPPDEQIRSRLTRLQYRVTQKDGTEPAFDNEFWNHKEPGIYVDIVSGEPLFASTDKFKSGTGWPSFVKPLVRKNVIEKRDSSLGFTRTEVRSKHADSHLGHVFDDGPKDRGGLRYCINSAALKFIFAQHLEKEGYGQWKSLFKK